MFCDVQLFPVHVSWFSFKKQWNFREIVLILAVFDDFRAPLGVKQNTTGLLVYWSPNTNYAQGSLVWIWNNKILAISVISETAIRVLGIVFSTKSCENQKLFEK